jgi:inner membrane protein
MHYPWIVDTLTHALSGALLARALTPSQTASTRGRWLGPPIPVWQAVTVGFVAAALPDADYALRFVSDIAYLRGHRGVTHSVILLPLWSLLLGSGFALAFGRWPAWKRYSWLCAAALAIHIIGDVITQFGTMIYAPLSDRRVELGSTFIIDLVISGILVAGLLMSALFGRTRMPAVVALAMLPLWVGVSLTGRSEALAAGTAYAAAAGLPAAAVFAAPRPASPFNWTVLVDDGARYHVAHLNTRRSQRMIATEDDHFIRRFSAPYLPIDQAQWQVRPKFGTDAEAPLARAVWDHPRFDFFRWFALFPALDHVARDGERTCVGFRDLRFEMPGRDAVPFRYGMCRQSDAAEWRLYTLEGDEWRPAL